MRFAVFLSNTLRHLIAGRPQCFVSFTICSFTTVQFRSRLGWEQSWNLVENYRRWNGSLSDLKHRYRFSPRKVERTHPQFLEICLTLWNVLRRWLCLHSIKSWEFCDSIGRSFKFVAINAEKFFSCLALKQGALVRENLLRHAVIYKRRGREKCFLNIKNCFPFQKLCCRVAGFMITYLNRLTIELKQV
jgi:hypothetical protein